MHLTLLASSLALDNVGNSKDARIAMIAMTTSNSMSVNARFRLPDKELGREDSDIDLRVSDFPPPLNGDRLSGNQLISAVLSLLFRFFKWNMKQSPGYQVSGGGRRCQHCTFFESLVGENSANYPRDPLPLNQAICLANQAVFPPSPLLDAAPADLIQWPRPRARLL